MNKSFLRNFTPFSSSDKNSLSQLTTSSNSHRDSISSIKSITSEDDLGFRNKIVLDETVNPKRPLRPNGRHNQNQNISPSASTQSSRPISHVSGEELMMSSSVSMQQIISNSSFKMGENFNLTPEEDDLMSLDAMSDANRMKAPPPKPPKPANINIKSANFLKFSNTPSSPAGLSDSRLNSQSIENLQQNGVYEPTKSTVSLNFKRMLNTSAVTKKLETTSDSVLNKVI